MSIDARSRQVGQAPAVTGPWAGDALLVVDLQHDFLPGGALGIAAGDAVLPSANRLIPRFSSRGLPVVLSRDWHPPDHCSFEAQGGPWPVHGVISKATHADQEAYSTFDGTGLLDQLRERGVRRVWLCGLATDYCLRATTLDARELAAEDIALQAVRLDSDDVAALSKSVRRIFDEAVFPAVRICVSGNLDEHEIARLLGAGAPRRKLSTGKATWPGAKQVFRQVDAAGQLEADVIGLAGERLPGEPLLVPVMRDGQRIAPAQSLAAEADARAG